MEKLEKKKQFIIVMVCVVLIVGIFLFYQFTHERESILTCTISEDAYKNYEEVITYQFKGNTLLYFKREEVVSSTTKEEVDDRYEYFLDIKNELEESKYLKYTVEKENLDVLISTEIEVSSIPTFFDSYMQASSIKSSSTKEEVLKYYKEEEYTCIEKSNV